MTKNYLSDDYEYECLDCSNPDIEASLRKSGLDVVAHESVDDAEPDRFSICLTARDEFNFGQESQIAVTAYSSSAVQVLEFLERTYDANPTYVFEMKGGQTRVYHIWEDTLLKSCRGGTSGLIGDRFDIECEIMEIIIPPFLANDSVGFYALKDKSWSWVRPDFYFQIWKYANGLLSVDVGESIISLAA